MLGNLKWDRWLGPGPFWQGKKRKEKKKVEKREAYTENWIFQ